MHGRYARTERNRELQGDKVVEHIQMERERKKYLITWLYNQLMETCWFKSKTGAGAHSYHLWWGVESCCSDFLEAKFTLGGVLVVSCSSWVLAVHLQPLSLGLCATAALILAKLHIPVVFTSCCLPCGAEYAIAVFRGSLAQRARPTLTLCSDTAKAQESLCELYS